MNNFFYKVNDVDYEVVVIHKRIKNIHYRFKDDHFVVSCSRLISKRVIEQGLDKYASKLISSSKKSSPYGEDYIYLFGEKVDLTFPGELEIEGYPNVKYKSIDDLLKKMRPIFLDVITSRVRYYEKVMKVPSYKVTIRKMSSRYGSNSKHTKHLNFSTVLLHYSLPIIDSVVVHELSHILVYDHSKKFYDVVYKYCPDYKHLRLKLRKGEFK